MEKPKLLCEDAVKMLFEKIKKFEVGDRIYEMVQEYFQDSVNEIEQEYEIVDYEGEPWSDEDFGEPTWYDESYEDFHQVCYDKIVKEFR